MNETLLERLVLDDAATALRDGSRVLESAEKDLRTESDWKSASEEEAASSAKERPRPPPVAVAAEARRATLSERDAQKRRETEVEWRRRGMEISNEEWRRRLRMTKIREYLGIGENGEMSRMNTADLPTLDSHAVPPAGMHYRTAAEETAKPYDLKKRYEAKLVGSGDRSRGADPRELFEGKKLGDTFLARRSPLLKSCEHALLELKERAQEMERAMATRR